MNRRAVLAGALCLFVIGLGVYVLTLRMERDTARMEAQEARQDAATWKAAAQSGEAAVRELAAVPLVIREEVPAYLTEPTPAPVLAGDTNLDLVGHVFDWQAALGACNADKAAIRAATGKE